MVKINDKVIGVFKATVEDRVNLNLRSGGVRKEIENKKGS